MTRICILASGSAGNSIYIEKDGSGFLIDAGLSGRETEKRLEKAGLTAEAIRAIVVTHDHSDHTKGVGILSRKWEVPVFVSEETYGACEDKLGKLHGMETLKAGVDFSLCGMDLHPFSTSHDAADPVSFIIGSNGLRIGMATDLGKTTALVRESLQDCGVLLLESNHDLDMLYAGPYPWHLKQRISGTHGHLSNEAACGLLHDIAHHGLRLLVLMHLSEENNQPALALRHAREKLSELGMDHVDVFVGRPDVPGRVHVFD